MNILKDLKDACESAKKAHENAVNARMDYKGNDAAEKNRLNLRITSAEGFLKRQELKLANFESSLEPA